MEDSIETTGDQINGLLVHDVRLKQDMKTLITLQVRSSKYALPISSMDIIYYMYVGRLVCVTCDPRHSDLASVSYLLRLGALVHHYHSHVNNNK